MKLFGIFSKPILGLKESGIGLVSRSSSYGTIIDEEPQNVSLQQKYLNAYHRVPIVSASIDITAEQAVQDFYFEGPNSVRLTKWAEVVNLPQKLQKILLVHAGQTIPKAQHEVEGVARLETLAGKMGLKLRNPRPAGTFSRATMLKFRF